MTAVLLLPWCQIDRSAQDVARFDTEKLRPFAVTKVPQPRESLA
jgi:hypothetical protein